ncbi:MAG: hypothetical protein M3452_08980 [Chloroflexota bacterium]|nr:hypothetical protein [Chloroflexota bacterium]
MTSPARGLGLAPASLAVAALVPLPVTPRRWRVLLLLAGLAALAGIFILTAIDAGGQRAVWENLHWTVAPIMGIAVTAARLRGSPTADRRALWSIIAGLSLFLLGQLTWMAQIMLGIFTVPAPSDLFFLLSGLPIAAAFVLSALERLDRGERVALILDVLTVFAALVAVTVSSSGRSRRASTPGAQ